MSMPASRPATKAGQRTASVDRIKAAALSQILRSGYHAASVDEIAKDAGMTKGSVYFYFNSKSALFLALLDEIESLVVDSIIGRIAKAGPTVTDKLVAALHGQGLLAAQHVQYLILFTVALAEFAGTGGPIEERLTEIYSRFHQTIETLVEEGQAAGEFKQDLNARELAAIVLAIEHGTLLEWYFRSRVLDGPTLVRVARNVLLQGLLTDPARSANAAGAAAAPAETPAPKRKSRAKTRTVAT
jgi:AcrR family transcriptional regulator